MGLRNEFEEVLHAAEHADDKIESMWARKRAWVIAGIVFALVVVGFILGRCSGN